MASQPETGNTPSLLTNEHLSNGREANGESIAPNSGGFAASVAELRVSHRETIGGLEVVEAAVADRLLMAVAQMIIAHDRWRLSAMDLEIPLEEGEDESVRKTKKNRVHKRRKSYRATRHACRVIIQEASGQRVSSVTTQLKFGLLSPSSMKGMET